MSRHQCDAKLVVTAESSWSKGLGSHGGKRNALKVGTSKSWVSVVVMAQAKFVTGFDRTGPPAASITADLRSA